MAESASGAPGPAAEAGLVVGIVGGGQLGRMLVQAARELGVDCVTLDPEANCPAAQAGASQITGSLFDADALARLIEQSSVTTFEIESTDADALARLEAAGNLIRPRPRTLKRIQNKLLQKEFLSANGIPTSPFEALETPSAGAVRRFGLPAVQKLQRGGYDGRGVLIIKSEEDLDDLLEGPSLVEEYVTTARELAVVGARAVDGDVRCYSVVDMTLGESTNMLEMLTAPADVPAEVADAALELGRRTIEAFDDVGVFAVEMFMTADYRLLVNEVSPRTHNSGHFTIDACVTSQFEQHIRAIAGMPLGDIRQIAPSAMINLLGDPGYAGLPVLEGEAEALAVSGVHIHLYGKRECRPHRKMGHVTVVDDTLEGAIEKAERVRGLLKIRGCETIDAA
ncbi:MAG: 5-(carboxyamino)imidazole ribonucleotide synthase [Proteobacteria bacterium]|nr:MAG: 5-(carboxyamino)imidazole ribonucleotide synthase [Pseudomonadota bacterium]